MVSKCKQWVCATSGILRTRTCNEIYAVSDRVWLVTVLQAEGTYQRAPNGHPVCIATDTSCNAFRNGSDRTCCCFGRPHLIDLFSFSLEMSWHSFTQFISLFKRGFIDLTAVSIYDLAQLMKLFVKQCVMHYSSDLVSVPHSLVDHLLQICLRENWNSILELFKHIRGMSNFRTVVRIQDSWWIFTQIRKHRSSGVYVEYGYFMEVSQYCLYQIMVIQYSASFVSLLRCWLRPSLFQSWSWYYKVGGNC